ncbi:4Fe-4S dicluster domain-containing protein [Desulfonema magnum]|uniref:Ion-translocating oxidoreductase complex, subunit C n=1 Tax=Desulfonema magnum TaxID=45655 RepID=A0A975GSK6_9BACT|nr:4Fe-4S dicluster domain-containing protein [Desulfonema magnum]QTA91183.1 Ion-translocating oxidoreductase complex, subunit C [Desulfonema magnum]
MMRRSFFGLAKPRFEYQATDSTPAEPEKIPMPKKVTLFFKEPCGQKNSVLLSPGDKVKTGQKLLLCEDSDSYIISSVTGTISSVTPYTGDFNASYTAISIDVAKQEEQDEQFGISAKDITLEAAKDFLDFAPGCPSMQVFSDPDKPIKTLVVCAADNDPVVFSNQCVVKSRTDAINKGVSILKRITGVDQVVVVSSQSLVKKASAIGGTSGVELRVVGSEYPAALPRMIMKDILGQPVPAESTCEDMGVCFFSAEAVASVASAFTNKQIPVTKTLTLIKKDMTRVLVEARIGTPIRDIFNACDVALSEKDRIIIGGPMAGSAVYSEDHPVQPDTDAIMVQDSEDVALVSDYPCINCGECVRICPARIAVNMLVRFCEAGEYETAADEYDLHSCIECGLCTVVCPSRMPVFQHIRLAKYELGRMNTEETNA